MKNDVTDERIEDLIVDDMTPLLSEMEAGRLEERDGDQR